MKFDNHTFRDETIALDGNDFAGCKFIRCHMVYRGEQGVSIVDCLFKEPTWALDGPASNTLKFLTVAYHHLGEAGIKLIESTFDSIRKGQLPVAKRNSDST